MHSIDLACRAVDDLLLVRLFAMERDDWNESLIVLRLAMTTTGIESCQMINSAKELLTMSLNNLRGALSTKATHAAQTVYYTALHV